MTWFRRLFGLERAPAPRLVTLHNRQDELEERLEYLAHDLRVLRGRVTGALRSEKPAENDPGPTNADEPSPQHPPLALAPRKRAMRGF